MSQDSKIVVLHLDYDKLSGEERFQYTFNCDPKVIAEAYDKGLYKKVAVVDSDDLDVAYRKTNTIERLWILNDGVIAAAGIRPRSTSVGDIMILNDKTAYVVAMVGFIEIQVKIHDGYKH